MRTIVILVDFDNVFPHQISEYSDNCVFDVLKDTIEQIRTYQPDVDFIDIRLYGGWYESYNLTVRASTLSVMMPELNSIFPILVQPKTIIKGRIELATQLYGHSSVWYNSYVEHAGLPKMRVHQDAMSHQCASNSSNCPVSILKKFSKTKTKVCSNNGCNVQPASVFFHRTQKYVDTMIACDIITLSTEENIIGIYVLSDDVDHFPAFAVARDLKNTKVKLGVFITNKSNITNYSLILNRFKTDVYKLNI